MSNHWFIAWQKDRLATAEKLPRERFQYGLSIAVVPPTIDLPRTHLNTDSRGETLAEGPSLRGLEFHFQKAAKAIDTNHFFAMVAGTTAPEIQVFDGGEHEIILSCEGRSFTVVVAKNGANVSIANQVKGDGFSGHILILIAEDDAVIECEHAVAGAGPFFLNTIGFGAKDAWLTVVERHETKTFIKSDTTFFLSEGAEGKADTRLRAETGSTYDVYHAAYHEGSHSRSQLFSRGVADTQGKIVYRGDIHIAAGLSRVDGRQDGKFIMLAPGASIDAIPALDIHSKDVSCSHALSITYPREDLLYYTGLRGLSLEEGKRLLVDGLLG